MNLPQLLNSEQEQNGQENANAALHRTTRFQYFPISPEEEEVAKTFNPVNILYLQNQRFMIAHELMNDAPSNTTAEAYDAFFLRRGFMQGKLELLDQLIGD